MFIVKQSKNGLQYSPSEGVSCMVDDPELVLPEPPLPEPPLGLPTLSGTTKNACEGWISWT